LGGIVLFLRVWQPKQVMTDARLRIADDSQSDVKLAPPLTRTPSTREMINAWVPWLILSVVVAFWATDSFKHLVNPWFSPVYHVPGVDKAIIQMPPAFPRPTP